MSNAEHDVEKGPKFAINIEGTEYPWDTDTISVPEIRRLGHLPETDPILEVDLKSNTERTLPEDEVIHIQPGKGYGKKVRFKRG